MPNERLLFSTSVFAEKLHSELTYHIEEYTHFGKTVTIQVDNPYNPELKGVCIEDEKCQQAIFGQAVSALHDYYQRSPQKARAGVFKPFFFLMNPNNPSQYLIGNLTGSWTKNRFEISSLLIHSVRNSADAMEETGNYIQHINPGVPKIVSDSWRIAMKDYLAPKDVPSIAFQDANLPH